MHAPARTFVPDPGSRSAGPGRRWRIGDQPGLRSERGVLRGGHAGFPATISAGGSYVLTGNLTVADPNLDGINVSADSVSLDLSEFDIAGPVTCSGIGSGLSG